LPLALVANTGHSSSPGQDADMLARRYVRALLGAGYLTFSLPSALFFKMEASVAGSFFERPF
jgi:hypothetical protein